MKKILYLISILFSLNTHAASITGTIEVRLVILPAPCIASTNQKTVSVNCGNAQKQVKTVVEKQYPTKTNTENYLVTIIY